MVKNLPVPTTWIASLLFCLGMVPALARPEEPRPPYDLGRVRGMETFPQDPGLWELLSANGFAMVPRVHRQIFSPYLENQ